MSHPFGAGKPQVNTFRNERSENQKRQVHPIEEVPTQPSHTAASQLGHPGDLEYSHIPAGHYPENSESSSTPNRSKRPGRGGNISCDRCRSHKNHVKKPCRVDPNDPNGACYPCVQAGLSEHCGERLPPPKRLARDMSRATQQSTIRQTFAADLLKDFYTSEVTSATQVEAIELTKLDSQTGAPPTPERADFVDRFADLSNADLNRNRPTHGLDQRPLISNPNMERGEIAPFFFPVFGEQEFALHLTHLPPSSSMLSLEGFPEFPGVPQFPQLPITAPDLQPIHTHLARIFPWLSPSIIIGVVDNMVAELSAQEGQAKQQGYFPDIFGEAEAKEGAKM